MPPQYPLVPVPTPFPLVHRGVEGEETKLSYRNQVTIIQQWVQLLEPF